ncbi:gliding motility-associated C-terminal domain-containing protein [Flavobacterium reichenbachii]|uniref:Uncharacterized protein n=1 Tax=Flavobacterium reichenbachii TaxID=362418 RepID=A0A085ZEP0_9FLAO|nr:gliding motility-associated C-terminal domain-containing protein [Flavobacterium reichenbachii]KFF02904.1 hypothetical protein IW19_22360 [Flavobacterium reichenbachii]OXB16896.1 hypothetical protein B0A68_05545 [Flavobacterium reichenbachii]
MKLNYSLLDFKAVQRFLLSIIFLLPVLSFSQNCTVNANVDRIICPGGEGGLPVDQFLLLGTANTDAGLGYLQNPSWIQISGPAVIIDVPANLQSLVRGASPGNSYGFRLTAQCQDGSTVSDDFLITIKPITLANAGTDQTYCHGTYVLNGNAVGASETGTWSIEGNNNAGISISNPNSPNASITVSGASSGSTTLRWTIVNSASNCQSVNEVVINTLGGIQPVTAGGDITLSKCYSSTQNVNLNGSFGGSTPGQQQGTWTVVSGPNIPNFSNANDNNTNVNGLIEGTYVLRWTVAGNCANGTDEVAITVPAPTADVTNVGDASLIYCDGRTSTVLQGTVPLYVNETVQWTQTGGPVTASIQNPASSSTLVTGMTVLGTYNFLYTLNNSTTGCTSTGTYNVTLEEVIAISAGPDQTLACSEFSAVIPVNSTGNGQMSWQIVSGPTPFTTTYPSFPTPLVNFSGNSVTIDSLRISGRYVIRLIKAPNPGSQCETVYDDVSILISAPPSASSGGTLQNLACNLTTAQLAGNTPTRGRGTWTQVSGPSTAVFSDVKNPETTVSGLINGKYRFRWTISGGSACEVTQSIAEVIVSSATPTQAQAGNNQSICFGSPIQLQGNATIASETGTWTVSPSAGVTFNDANDPSAIASGLAQNTTYTFTWTIVNGCGSSVDTVDVSTNATQGATAAAGTDQCLVTGTTTVTLAGNNPSPGTGLWIQTGGTAATITNPTQFNTTVTGLSDGNYEFQWTVSNIGCTDAQDTVAITIAPAITIAQAGNDQNICGPVATLSGNTPAAGETGLWEFVSGGDGPLITDPTNPNTTITGLSSASWVYQWTISRGACAVSSDAVQLNVSQPPSIAIAGSDQTVCNQTSVTLGAAAPDAGTNGLWSLISGPNSPVFSNVAIANSTLSGLVTGEYILEWTTYTGINCPASKDQVSIKVTEAAAAGSDFSTCLAGPLYLTGNPTSTGTWAYVSGGIGTPTITSTGNNSAAVTGLFPGVYVFRYTIAAQGSCPESSDDIQVTVNGQASTASAGPDQVLCSANLPAQEIQLAATNPIQGTGLWTVLAGPSGGTFDDASLPNAKYINPGFGIYVFNWTVTSGSCSNSDQVRVEYAAAPSATIAEGDNAVCGSMTELTATPPTVGTGKWAQVSGPTTAVFSSEILPITTVSNLTQTGGVYIFSWTVTNGTVCTPTTTNVQITVTADLTVPQAGPDQTICQSSTAALAANTITVGTGQWSQFSGPANGSFSNTASPASTFTPNGAGSYVLRWTATNLSCVFSDDVTITVDPLPATSAAGTPFSICEFQALNLNANTPTIGTGLWTQISGPTTVVFETPTSAATAVFGTQAGVYEFQWTISSGSCPASSSTVSITINPLPQLADAGIDQTICNASTAGLNGNNPSTGTGTWTFVSNAGNSAIITNPNAFNTTVTNISIGTTRLKWTISNGSCTAYSDEANIVRPADLTTSVLTSGSTICEGGTITLNTTPSGSIAPYTYQWQSSADGATGWADISGQTNSSFTSAGSLTAGEYYYRVNVSSTCAQVISNTAKLTIIQDPVVTTQPIGNTICSGTTHTMTVAATTTNPAAGTIAYQWQSSADGASGWTSVLGGTGMNTDTYTTAALNSNLYFRVLITQSGNGCEAFSDPALINVTNITAQPTTPAAICIGGTVNISVTASVNGGSGTLSYQWQSNSGSGFVNETNPTAVTPNFISDVLNLTTQFRVVITSSAINCVLTSNTVTATVVPDPAITVQPTGTTICSGGNHTLSVSATNGTPSLTYQWFSSLNNITFTTIAGATAATYVTPVLTQTTYYRVDVTATGNGCTTITSNVAAVTVLSDVSITTQPVQKTNICSGSTAVLSVTASGGSGNYTYQWKNAIVLAGPYNDIPGAVSASYTTPVLTQNTYYQVAISDGTQGCDPVISSIAAVIIPSITTQPSTPPTVCVGGTISVSAQASANGGSANFTYQWQSSADGTTGWANVSGGTGGSTANYTSGPLTATTYYRSVISSSTPACTLITNVVTAAVIPDPTIALQPVGGNICEGGTFTLTANAANGSGTYAYQWQKSLDGATGWANVTDGTGANTTSYTTGVLNADTFYRLQVTDSGIGCGVVSSNVAKVDVFESPIINVQPVNGEVCINQTHVFTVTATGNIPSGTLLYQWQTASALTGPYTNVTDGTGGTTASYTTPAYAAAGNRYFRVLISQSQAGCQTTSNQVTLNVFDVPAAPIGLVTQQPSCTNATGTIAITNPDLGTGYEYSKDGITFQASNIFTGLASGNVPIYVRRIGLNTCISSAANFTIFNRICAVPESFASISGDVGGNTGTQTILNSDKLNGIPVTASNVQVTINSISSYLTFNSLTNTISVASGTPADDYTLTYTICEVGNLSNCSTTTETIEVTTAGIDARIDVVVPAVNGYTGANNVINALTNDRLASAQATLSNVTLSVTSPASPIDPAVLNVPVLDISTGNVNVPAGTVKGIYEIKYRICEIGNPSNCDTASILVQVQTTIIDADDDAAQNINGYTGQINVINALTNDSLNGVPITTANFDEITVTQETGASAVYPGANVPIFSTTTGWVTVPEGTPADTYYIKYHICEKLNPSNCSDASIAIVVDPAPLIVNDNLVPNVNGYEGAVNIINAYTSNDTFNGAALNINLAGLLTPSILIPATPKTPGAPVPELVAASGRVNIPPGTPEGQYQIKYQICENLNTPAVPPIAGDLRTGNCDDAVIIINVTAPPILANDDTVSNINSYSGGTDVINAFDNDLLNGGAIDLTIITANIISNPSAINGGSVPTFDITTGFVSVPAGTPAGEYKFVYEICENLNTGNCDQATITITVIPAQIDAVNDIPFASINGFVGNPNAINALDNDTLNGILVIPSEVQIDVLIPAGSVNGSLVPILNPLTGNVNVPAGTAAGNYNITYRLSEKLNLTNTDIALISIEVTAPVIEANDDTIANINGYAATTNAVNVLSNDTLNGSAVILSNINITVDAPAVPINSGPIPVLEPLSGNVSIPAGTPGGDYEIKYTICEKINTTNCNDASVFINVIGAPIIAADDIASGINGFAGANNVVNALTNDTLNGVAVIPSQVTISNIVPAASINGGAVPVLDPSGGSVNVPSGTSAGSYTIQYRLSENLNLNNFDTATITINVSAPTIIANNDSANNINGFTGANNIINAITNDRLNGLDIQLIKINITSISTSTPAGYISGNPIPVLNTLTGNVDVPAGTSAGIYVIHYRICEKLNPLNCSEADVTINITTPIIDADNDFANNINGYAGADNVVNALANDELNGAPVPILQIDIHSLNTTPPASSTNGIVPILNLLTGFVDVPVGTSAGTYTIQYEICQKINPANCSSATIIIVVNQPTISAEDDSITNINGFAGAGNVLNAFTNNDTYNGVLLTDTSLINPTIITPATPINGGLVPTLDLSTGFVSIPAGTSAGAYQIRYRICDKLNPSNCDEAVINIVVIAPIIAANDDAVGNIIGYSGANNVINAYTNDTLNGAQVVLADINKTLVSPASSINGAPIPVLNLLTGNVDVPAGTHEGEYKIVYKICDRLNPSNCDDAIITITVIANPIDAVDDSPAAIFDGSVNTANAVNVLDNDTLNGVVVIPSEVQIDVLVPASSINGGLVPILNPSTGIVNIPAGTTTGTYTIEYRLSEKLNLGNTDTAVIAIQIQAPILAVNDASGTINGYVGAVNVVNVISNDLLNGTAVQLSQINITSINTATPADYTAGNPVPILNITTGNVDVPAGTSAGNYIIHYGICEKQHPVNCSEADITVEVTVATIIANNDVDLNINGYTGSANALNVLDNDSFNDSSIEAKNAKIKVINISQITITVLDPADPINGNPNVPSLDPATGIISVPSQTPAGLYRIEYRISENLNPANFDDAAVFITVTAAFIEANNDTVLNINGFKGQANVLNAITNDNLNGVAAQLAEITIGVVTPAASINGGPVPALDVIDGNVNVPAGTPSGSYTIRYQICENLNPANCSPADIIVTVISGPIVANDDAVGGINGLDGANNVLNVLANDLLDNGSPTLTQVKINVLTPADVISSAAVPVLNTATGMVSVPAGTSSGTYTIVYEICENLNPANCDQAVIKITVVQPSVALVKRGVFSDTNGDGYAQPGELIRYTFLVSNTGSMDLNNVTVTDPKATISGSPIASLPVGQLNVTNYTGTYVLTQADINLGTVTNQALVTAQPSVGTSIQDLSDSDDPTLIGNDNPTVTPVTQFAELTLIKSGRLTGSGGVGSVINYSFTVKNTGNVILTNLEIADPLIGSAKITVTPNVLIPNAVGTAAATYSVTIGDVAQNEVVNTAIAAGETPDGKLVFDVSDSDDPTLQGDDDPTVIDLTLQPSIAIVKTGIFNDENKNGFAEIGETITYHFAITNTGNVPLVNIIVKDPKPGLVITGDPIILTKGVTNTDNFVGTYVLTFEDIDVGSVENQATVQAVDPKQATVTDTSDDNSATEDDPTILSLNACKIAIYNAVSPNGDGRNEIFKIDNIKCYGDSYVQIYDRWGVLVYDAYNYDNESVAFRGISEGRATVNKQKRLPDGTYFYVITYTTYLNEPVSKTGYLYLSGN